MTRKRHSARHAELHQVLNELVADMIVQTGKRPSQTTVLQLIEWSGKQTKGKPSEAPVEVHGETSRRE